MGAIRSTLNTLTAVIVLSLIVGCGGGGSAVATVKGVLTDGFGAIINLQTAVITLDGTGQVAHPGPDGSFQLTAPPGQYVLRASLSSEAAGFQLGTFKNIALVEGQIADVGNLPISNSSLEGGWTSYRQGKFLNAETSFNAYLDDVRSGQAVLGQSSVYDALGWTHGRGLNMPVQASIDFSDAISGWGGNLDAFVGLSGSELAMMKSDGSFHFNSAVSAINSAIDIPGDYSSTPAHDGITELDLKAYRAFLNMLNGNVSGARDEALAIKEQVTVSGSPGSSNAIEVVLAFTE